MSRFKSIISLFIVLLLLTTAAAAQGKRSKDKKPAGKAVIWKPVKIGGRDLYWGAGGRAMYPNLKRITFIRKETGGNNLKYRIKDGSGRIWVAKIADESQPETAAVRLLWAVGYPTEINYLVPTLTIPGKGTFKNVRLEARPENIDRQDRWSWTNNPFNGTRELQGLKIMMALINNWDLKDGNNVILQSGGERQYVISDLGSSFGKFAPLSLPIFNRFGRSVNNPEHYVKSEFVKGVEEDGDLDFAYKGNFRSLFDDISPAHGRWVAGLLGQLSDRQIRDAFRAANYSPSEITMLSRAVRGKIRQLELMTRPQRSYQVRN
ncbi:MAG TPA: hypothetical protein VIL74_14990 [Pyrinomonadaceae bacterium]|jgi:hypothetical protein